MSARENFLLGPLMTLRTDDLLPILLELMLQEFHLLVMAYFIGEALVPGLLFLGFSPFPIFFVFLLVELRFRLEILLIGRLLLLRELINEVLAHFLFRLQLIMLLNHRFLGFLYSFGFGIHMRLNFLSSLV